MTQTVDTDFAARVAAYEQKHKRGVAFEADGTLGGHVAKAPRAKWRANWFRRTVKLAVFLVMLKASLYHSANMVGYNARAGVVMDSDGFAQNLLAIAFYPDPLSVEISKYLRIGQQFIASELRKAL